MFLKGTNDQSTKVLVYESAGFLAIITLCWLDELLSLTSLLLHGNEYIPNFHESAVEMLLVLTVWLLVAGSTRRLLKRVRYLEEFMRVCAWCHRVKYKEHWMPMEQFFQQGFDTPTTHGICPHCLARNKAALERSQKARNEASSPATKESVLEKKPEPAVQNASTRSRHS